MNKMWRKNAFTHAEIGRAGLYPLTECTRFYGSHIDRGGRIGRHDMTVIQRWAN